MQAAGVQMVKLSQREISICRRCLSMFDENSEGREG